MAFPLKLKHMSTFNDGNSYVGETISVTLPKLTRKLEEYRGGGMNRPVKVDLGGEALELEATYGGPMREILRQYGMLDLGGVTQRFVGAYQNDDTGEVSVIEIVTRGRHEEIDMGEAKPGEGGEFKVKSSLSYYKLIWSGTTEIEIDVLNMTEIVGGVDRMADLRSALGLY